MFSGDEKVLGWGCSRCRGDEFADDEMEEVNRAARNCDGTHPESENSLVFPWVPRSWEGLRMCPWGQIGEVAWHYFSVWSDWKNLGLLPYPGGLGEQPSHIVEAIRVVEHEVTRAKVREQRAAQRAHEKPAPEKK